MVLVPAGKRHSLVSCNMTHKLLMVLQVGHLVLVVAALIRHVQARANVCGVWSSKHR